MNSFTWNGVNCATYDIICSNGGTYDAPESDVENIEIPGRNGTLTVDNKRYKNAPGRFQCYVRKNFAKNAGAIRAWLKSSRGYCRLEDDAHPYEFRLAKYVNSVQFEPMYTDREAEFEITFDCAPQRFLKSGEETIEFTAPGVLFNPTLETALPTITLTGDGPGELIINGHTIQISDVGGNVTLNREIRRAYAGTTPRDYTMTGRFDWLGLVPGENTISFNGGITAVSIIPRWWTV